MKRRTKGPIKIDLTGPEGNAFVLLGYASKWAKQFGLDPKPILEDMKSGDYEHLVSALDKHLGEFVVLLR